MIGSLDIALLQQIWWILGAVVGSLFLFLTFVQGGQSLLWQVAKSDTEKALVINSLGMKWELTFTTLVLFGGALFAAFPKFYATSFGGAYWVWILILFTFVIQAVSYEYRRKPGNLLGARTYEFFLLLNGTVGILLIGAAVGTFFTGSNFVLDDFNRVTWTTPFRGLEAALSFFNLSMGLFLVFNSRVLGSMYLINNIDCSGNPEFEARLRKSCLVNLICALPFLLYVLGALLLMDGFTVGGDGVVAMEPYKYLHNLLAMPVVAGLLVAGLVLVVAGVLLTALRTFTGGIWFGGLGTVLVGLAIFFLAGFNNTPFYNASSSHFTLTAMTYVAFLIPFVLGYICWVWAAMNRRKMSVADVTNNDKAY